MPKTSADARPATVAPDIEPASFPFALAAGLSGAVDNSRIIVVAGLAEIAAGSIAMGLGGYLAAKSDAEHYVSERLREEREVEEIPEEEAREVQKVFADYGFY